MTRINDFDDWAKTLQEGAIAEASKLMPSTSFQLSCRCLHHRTNLEAATFNFFLFVPSVYVSKPLPVGVGSISQDGVVEARFFPEQRFGFDMRLDFDTIFKQLPLDPTLLEIQDEILRLLNSSSKASTRLPDGEKVLTDILNKQGAIAAYKLLEKVRLPGM